MSIVHIHAPPVKNFCALNTCPTCERPRRMLGQFAEWYGTTWTCLGCGDRWMDGECGERPFARGWRQQSIRHARAILERMGLQA